MKCKRCNRDKKVTKTGFNPGLCKSCISWASSKRKRREVKKPKEIYCQECGKETKEWEEIRKARVGILKLCRDCI